MTDGCLMLVGRRQYEMLKKMGGFPRNPSIALLQIPRPWLLPDGRHVLAARLEGRSRAAVVGSWIAGVDLGER